MLLTWAKSKLPYFKPSNLSTTTKRLIITISRYSEIKVDECVDPNAELRDFKNHVGKYSLRGIKVPDYLETSINDVLSDESFPHLREDCKRFREKLLQRDTLFERNKRKYKHITDTYIKQINEPDNVALIGEQRVKNLEDEIQDVLKTKNKDKIEYKHRESLLYLASRFGSDYATMFQIFSEIKKKEPKFQPKRLFDFGSGVGTSMWAANELWNSSPIETFNFDVSTYMNSTAEAVIKKCKSKKDFFKFVKFKRNIPKSMNGEFDLITCSFTLLDLPDRLSRLKSVETMWEMLENNGYLILVETGNSRGFQVINEVRDFFLEELVSEGSNSGHIFSPCPHHMKCPLVQENRVCKFQASHALVPIYDFLNLRNDLREFPYSFVVLKKSPKPESFRAWPRFVLKDPEHRKKSTYNAWICRGDVGRVDNLVSSKSRHKITNWLVRYSRAGDSLPISISDYVKTDKRDNDDDKSNQEEDDSDSDNRIRQKS